MWARAIGSGACPAVTDTRATPKYINARVSQIAGAHGRITDSPKIYKRPRIADSGRQRAVGATQCGRSKASHKPASLIDFREFAIFMCAIAPKEVRPRFTENRHIAVIYEQIWHEPQNSPLHRSSNLRAISFPSSVAARPPRAVSR